MVLFESTTFETYYRLRKTWKFTYYFLHFCIFLHILLHFCICVYILHIFFCIFCSFTVYNFIKLYTVDTDWRFNISIRCSLFCATAELKELIQLYEHSQEYVNFFHPYLPISIILRSLSNRNFIFSKLLTKICHYIL